MSAIVAQGEEGSEAATGGPAGAVKNLLEEIFEA